MRSRDDIERIYSTVAARLEPLGHKVYIIVNYDGFDIDRELLDVYSDMVHTLVSRYYLAVTRYTTSAFLRMRLAPRLGSVYATREEADQGLGDSLPR